MKKLYNILIILLLLPAVTLTAKDAGGKYTKQKQINKAYIVNPDAWVDIENNYGNIVVATWDEDKIEINVVIKVSGNDEDWVNKRLASINVEINALKHLVSAKTIIGNFSRKSGKSNSMEISYTVKIPRKGGTKLDNKYGDIVTADLYGPTQISGKYGRLTMAKLNNANNDLDMEYVNPAVINYVKTGRVRSNYSKVVLNSFDKLNFSSNYSDLTISNGDALNYESNYGTLSLGKIANLNGKGNYLTIASGEISGNLNLETEYSSIKIGNITASAGNVSIKSGYTSITLEYNPGYSFDFDIQVKYASLKYNDLQVTAKNESSNTKTYKGFFKKSGVNKLAIDSDYGEVRLTKN